MSKAAQNLTQQLLEAISKIDAALAAKQITPESADILRRQAAAQTQAAFDAAKAAEEAERKAKLKKQHLEEEIRKKKLVAELAAKALVLL